MLWSQVKREKIKITMLSASFTVEAAFVVPMILLIVVLLLNSGYEWQNYNIEEAQKSPAVEHLDPVEEKYRQWNL